MPYGSLLEGAELGTTETLGRGEIEGEREGCPWGEVEGLLDTPLNVGRAEGGRDAIFEDTDDGAEL